MAEQEEAKNAPEETPEPAAKAADEGQAPEAPAAQPAEAKAPEAPAAKGKTPEATAAEGDSEAPAAEAPGGEAPPEAKTPEPIRPQVPIPPLPGEKHYIWGMGRRKSAVAENRFERTISLIRAEGMCSM